MNERRFEVKAAEIMDLCPSAERQRTRDAIQIVDGGMEGVVLILTPEALELRLPTVEWNGPANPVPSSRLWKRLAWERIDDTGIATWVERARAARKREYRRCRHCKTPTPPEHRLGEVCHGCASEHEGIVF